MKKLLFVLLISTLFLVGCTNKYEYRSDLQGIADDILSNSADIEDLLNEYANLWQFSISSGTAISVEDVATATGLSQDDIREYFQLNVIGNVPGNFSTNIYSYKEYLKATGELDKVEDESNSIKERISELKNPPSGFEETYDELLDMFNQSQEFLRMALNPDGSLQSFNEKKGNLSTDILNKYDRIEVIMPDE